MKVALAQINPTVGDFQGNAARILRFAREAHARRADLAVFTELAVMGYPPRDLVEHAGFVQSGIEALHALAAELPLPALVGFVSRNDSGEGKPLYNSAAFIAEGRVRSVHHKSLLPTYDVFDEDRYFEPGSRPEPLRFRDRLLGITICEDLWRLGGTRRPRYHFDPVTALKSGGAQALINLSASPFTLGKMEVRRALLAEHARKLGVPLVYVNQVGGNDELVFDGGSMVVNARGELVAQARLFEEDLLVVNLDDLPPPLVPAPELRAESAFRAVVLGTRDYLHKCGFKAAVLGLSGGIDSALTAVVAAEALGRENVLGVSLPSRFSSQHSRDDARILAERLGIRYMTLPIETVHQAFLNLLAEPFAGRAPDLAEENLQARIRGVILMALSNKFGMLALTTGNKSELATGYCTLYGDMCGGLAPISDLPKMLVYEIARWVNRHGEIIPQSSLDKPPSAELRPNQTDQDTLPPYDLVDRVLNAYVEEEKDIEAIVASGVDRAVVLDVVRRIEQSEYKRRQAVPGLKLTSRAFGYGRRVPVAKRVPGV